MPKKARPLQSNFGAGEIAPELAMRLDTAQYRNGAKSLLNNQLLMGGGARRRPGSWWRDQLPGPGRPIEWTVNESTKYVVVFTAGRMDAYRLPALSASGFLTGCPWTADDLAAMDWSQFANTMIVTHDPNFLKVITRTGVSSWTIDDFAWTQTAEGRIKQPHAKLALDAVTIEASAVTGSVTLQLAGGVRWTADHVGSRIRILDREVLITAVTDGNTATGTVKERLRPSQRLIVVSLQGFAVGDVVASASNGSGAKGVIVAMGSGVSALDSVNAANGGAGYADNDVLEVSGGTATTRARVKVTSETGGVIDTLTVTNAGSYTSLPNNPVSFSTITGSGIGATANLTWDNSNKFLDVAITEKLTLFEDDDDVVGPNQDTSIQSASVVSPLPVKDWTEQLYSDGNGYPRCIEFHRQRILLAGSASLPSGIAGSRLGDIYDFDVGDASDADGFLETVGDAAAVGIVQLHSAEQLLVFTDKGPYYVPETSANPFRPTSLAFNHFGDNWPVSAARTAEFDGGVIFCSGSLVIKAEPTGDISRSWAAKELSYLAPHLLFNVVDAAFTNNFSGGPERFGHFINRNGSMATMMLADVEKIRNFVPWRTTNGSYLGVCGVDGILYAVVERPIDGENVYVLEEFDPELTLDSVTTFFGLGGLENVASRYGSETVQVVTEAGFSLGVYPFTFENPPAGPYRVGFQYARVLETLPPIIEDSEGNHAGGWMRITAAHVRTVESARFAVNGTELQAYTVAEDPALPPPLRTGFQRIQMLGWSQGDPTVQITSPDPLPLTVLGIQLEVSY